MKFRLRDYLYPLQLLAHHNLMNSAPWWTPSQLDEWSRARRKAIVIHAYHNVPYYRQLLDENGILPEKVDDPEVWTRIPKLDKNSLRNNIEALTARDGYSDGSVWASTSGSTGIQASFLLDKHVNSAAFALLWRAWSSGRYWQFGQRQAAMKGLYHPKGWRYHRAIRTLELSSVQINRRTVRLYSELIHRYRPRFLRGYPSSMYLFCRLLREEGISLNIPMIISGSETLHGFQRTMIEDTLKGRLYNHYTHWERAASILECDSGFLHAQEDYGHHEILDANGKPVPPGVLGEITVTGLYNLAMPLIRYETGDIASWSLEPCSCGQSFPVVERIEGRQTDYIISPTGGLTPGTSADFDFETIPAILYSQLIQKEIGSLEVRIVRTREYQDLEDSQRVRDVLATRLGADINIDIRFCTIEELERNPVGKIRSCINLLPPEVMARYGLPLS